MFVCPFDQLQLALIYTHTESERETRYATYHVNRKQTKIKGHSFLCILLRLISLSLSHSLAMWHTHNPLPANAPPKIIIIHRCFSCVCIPCYSFTVLEINIKLTRTHTHTHTFETFTFKMKILLLSNICPYTCMRSNSNCFGISAHIQMDSVIEMMCCYFLIKNNKIHFSVFEIFPRTIYLSDSAHIIEFYWNLWGIILSIHTQRDTHTFKRCICIIYSRINNIERLISVMYLLLHAVPLSHFPRKIRFKNWFLSRFRQKGHPKNNRCRATHRICYTCINQR